MKQQTIKIIIADDDAMMRIGLKAMLPWEQYGYQIIGEAKDGKEALALCAQRHPDILIRDMKMAETDGLEVLRTLSQWEQRPQTIVLSGYDEFALVREAMRLGACDYLLKQELSPTGLLQCLQNVQQKLLPKASEEQKTGEMDWKHTLRNLIRHFYLTDQEMDEALLQTGIRFETQTVYCMLIRAGGLVPV